VPGFIFQILSGAGFQWIPIFYNLAIAWSAASFGRNSLHLCAR